MKKLLKLLGIFLAVLLAGCVVLWILGPLPVSMGPYVQNVGPDSAEICCFDEAKTAIQVRVSLPDGSSLTRTSESAAIHRVRVTGLQPHSMHSYVILDADGLPRWKGRFLTAKPAPGAGSQAAGSTVTFAAAGDSGDLPNWFKLQKLGWGRMRGMLQHTERTAQWDVAQWIAAQQPDLFVHLGDVIYSHNELPAYEEAFFRPFEAVLRRSALVATFGNHDMHRWERPWFFRLFRGPEELDPKQAYRDFSFTFAWGQVRFLVLDGYWQKWGQDSPVRAWLQKTLAEDRHPVRIVFMHFPLFSDEEGATQQVELRQRLLPILAKHRVALVISGDSHNYQRFKPVDGVRQIIVGTGGKSIRPVAATARLDHYEERFGFLLVKVVGRRIEGEFRTGAEAPLDRFVITQ